MIVKINKLLKVTLAALAICLSSFHSDMEAVLPETQFTFDGQTNQIVVASDNSNNAVTVMVGATEMKASYFTGGAWGAVTLISGSDFPTFPAVAMDGTGTALAMWWGFGVSPNMFIRTALFSGGVWTTPTPDPLYTSTGSSAGTSIAMDGSGKGLATWGETNTWASFYSGTWAAPVDIGTGLPGSWRNIKASYSSNGNASVVWQTSPNIYANTYNGSTWIGLQTLDTTPTSGPDAGIDNLGNTIAVWKSGASNDIVTRRFNGTSWSAAQTLSTAPANLGRPSIAVASDGTAVAVWTDSGNNIRMNLFNGTTWSAPIFVVASSQNPQVSMDSTGDALIGWISTGGIISMGRLVKGSTVLDHVDSVATPVTNVLSFDLAFASPAPTGFAVWNSGSIELPDAYGTFDAFPRPATPTGLNVQVCNNRFASQKDCINTITWDPSLDPTVVSYTLNKDGVFLASIPVAGPLVYVDNVLCQVTAVYDLYAVDGDGALSDPATETVTFVCNPPPCP